MTIEEIRKAASSGCNRYYECEAGIIYLKKNFIHWHYWCKNNKMWIEKKFNPSFRLKIKPLY